jgi:hypothetical protein
MEVTMNLGDDPFVSNDEAPYRCEICGTSLTYSGRGRKPKFCSEHRKGGTTTSNGRKATANMAVLENNIADLYRGLGMGLSFVDPISGMEVAGSADKLAASWITLAESNPKVKKFLIRITTGTGVGAVVIAHATVAYPILKRNDMLPNFLGGKAE